MQLLYIFQGTLSLVVGTLAGLLLLVFMRRADGKHTRAFLVLLMAQMFLTYVPNGLALIYQLNGMTREIIYTQSLLVAVIAISFGMYYMFWMEAP